jgi:inositol-phosphate phosphatase / L-galactose 1-phosphate phosphatase / histidinol-phosphatase
MTSSSFARLAPLLAQVATAAAEAAGVLILRDFRQPLEVLDKDDASPVTRTDRAAEQLIRTKISIRFPDHGIIGEEYGSTDPDAEYVWVIDPIDGTRAFITGKPLFGTLIAVLHQGRPVVGVLYQPVLRELWLGVTGQPTTLNGQIIWTGQTPRTLAGAMLATTSPALFAPHQKRLFDAVAERVRGVNYGGDCYNYGLLAAGFIDLVIEHTLKFHDCAALLPIITGAGGIVTDWQGQEITATTFDGGVAAAGNAALHEAVLELLQGGKHAA